MLSMLDQDLKNKRVLIREDLNVPIKNGIITSDQRLQAALPTLQKALESKAAVIVLSHLGRPKEGEIEAKFSLEPLVIYLSRHLKGYKINFVKNYLDALDAKPGELTLCENVRFNVGETSNDPDLAKKLANLCDIFVMDAFGTAHRKHASTYGVAKFAKLAVAGPLLLKELSQLEKALENPKKPIVAIVGGAKISSKLSLLKELVSKVDILIPGGGIANTFLKAKEYEIGLSLCENALLQEAQEILRLAEENNCNIVLPTDVVVGKACEAHCPAYNKLLKHIAKDDLIMDVGPETIANYVSLINKAQTIIWNGPLGVFEYPQFSYGTRAIAIAIANSDAVSIAGGGDTLAAIDLYDLTEQISYISTGGGAFLKYLQDKSLPAVEVLDCFG